MPNAVESIVGATLLLLPGWLVLFLALRKQHKAIRRFGLALLVVGIGYLVATGAAASIGAGVLRLVDSAPMTKAP